MHDDKIEAAAVAAFEYLSDADDGSWSDLDAEQRDAYRELAQAAISTWMEKSHVVPFVRRDE